MHPNFKFILVLTALFATTIAPASEHIDDPLQVLDFHFELEPADWEIIRHDQTYDIEKPAYFICGDEDPLYVSLRRKPTGAIPSDENPIKVSLKVDVDEYVADQEWHSHRKISLENGDDGMLVKEGLSWLLMARAGLITGSASWVRVYVNGNFMGVYTRVEQIDKSFLRRHIDEDEGWLYKEGEQRTNEGEPDPYEASLYYEPFDKAGDIPGDGYASTPEHCDLHQLLGIGAVNAFLVNPDGLLAKENNHWWYNSVRPRLYFPWDLDTVMHEGDEDIDPHNFGNAQRDFQIYLLGDPWTLSIFDDILTRLVDDSFDPGVLDLLLDDLHTAVGPAIDADPLNDLDRSASEEFSALSAWFHDRVSQLELMLPSPDPFPVVINELLASNRGINRDEGGEYADWVELYNRGAEPVQLGGYFLSDDPARPDRWEIPDITIAPGEYVLIWCDNDTLQGPLHTGFRLDADGERVGLYEVDGFFYSALDYAWFGPQDTDVSFGRLDDGSPGMRQLRSPTPGAPNVEDSPLVLTVSGAPAAIQRGEVLSFMAAVENTGGDEAFLDDAAIRVAGPLEAEISLYSGPDIAVQGYGVINRPILLSVPGTAPPGLYEVSVTISLDGLKLARDAFEIEVLQ